MFSVNVVCLINLIQTQYQFVVQVIIVNFELTPELLVLLFSIGKLDEPGFAHLFTFIKPLISIVAE